MRRGVNSLRGRRGVVDPGVPAACLQVVGLGAARVKYQEQRKANKSGWRRLGNVHFNAQTYGGGGGRVYACVRAHINDITACV